MNGKDYVVQAKDLAAKLLLDIKAQGSLGEDPRLEQAAKVCADLERLQSRATLRTKNGANMAFPVLDAAQKLAEAWESVQSGGAITELTEELEGFIHGVEVLEEALKERTVIMT